MIDARAWESTLAEAVATDEGAEVRLYSITSLGKLRSRRYLRLLVDLYDSLRDKERLFASQAIARIVGIARYEL
jgi:hypothetical protein